MTGERQHEHRGHTTSGGGSGGALPSWRSEATLSQTDLPGAPPPPPPPVLITVPYTPPRLRPAAKYPQLRIVPCRHTHAHRPPCFVCNACARLLVRILFDFLFSGSPPSCHHRAPQGTHPAPSLPAPRPHRRFAYPPPPPRPALLRLVRPPPPTTTPPQRAHHAARPPASSRRVGRLRTAGAAPCCAEPAGTTPPARFSTPSAPDARCSSAPSRPCRLTSVQVRAARLGVGGSWGTAARERLPTRACARPGACRAAWARCSPGSCRVACW